MAYEIKNARTKEEEKRSRNDALSSLFSPFLPLPLPLVVVLELAPVGPARLPERPDLLFSHILARLLEGLPVQGAELVEAL